MEKKMRAIIGADTSEYDKKMDGVSKRADIVSERMKAAMQKAKEALQPFKEKMQEVESKFFDLSETMDSFKGTNTDFMNQVKDLGAEYKQATDNMLKNNNFLRADMLQTAGSMMNMTTQAQRISENYDRMANPLYKVNQAGLKVADTLNKIANNGHASVLALKLLGPTANMKQLLDMQNMINQGLVRFQMVALAAAVTGVLVYSSLHKAAMKANEGYKKSFEQMVASLRKAFEPMVQAFAAVMTPIYKFITAIANMIIKFNEAHPTLAKFLQGIVMLIPLLTLLLSPLAIGIGLLAGFQAAWAAVWAMIGPLITGLAAMSATVWLVAAAIVAVVAAIWALWTYNEGFRNAVISAWQAIQAAAITVWNYILNSVLIPVWNAIVAFAMQIWGQLQSFWEENGDSIMKIAKVVWDFVREYVIARVKALVATLTVLWNILSSVIKSVWGSIKGIISGAVNVILGIIGLFVSVLTGDWKSAWENVKRIIKGAWEAIGSAARLGADILLGIIKGIGKSIGGTFESMTDIFYNAGKGFMDMLKQGINDAIGGVLGAVESVAGRIREFLPFSPAKVGPLSDLDKLDFAGPIMTSIYKGTPIVQSSMTELLAMPNIYYPTIDKEANNGNSNKTVNVYTQSVDMDEAGLMRALRRVEVLYG